MNNNKTKTKKYAVDTLINVRVNGQEKQMSVLEIMESGLNVLINKTNGYSHDWQEVEVFDCERHTMGYYDKWTGKHQYPRLYLTDKQEGIVRGSSVVSFS